MAGRYCLCCSVYGLAGILLFPPTVGRALTFATAESTSLDAFHLYHDSILHDDRHLPKLQSSKRLANVFQYSVQARLRLPVIGTCRGQRASVACRRCFRLCSLGHWWPPKPAPGSTAHHQIMYSGTK